MQDFVLNWVSATTDCSDYATELRIHERSLLHQLQGLHRGMNCRIVVCCSGRSDNPADLVYSNCTCTSTSIPIQ